MSTVESRCAGRRPPTPGSLGSSGHGSTGCAATSGRDLNEVASDSTNGNMKTNGEQAPARCTGGLTDAAAWLTAPSAAGAVAAPVKTQDHHEDDERDRRRPAHRAVLEALAVDQVRRRQRGLLRPAGRHRVHLVEDLPGADQAERQHQEQRGLHQRQGDPEEALPGDGAVDQRRPRPAPPGCSAGRRGTSA